MSLGGALGGFFNAIIAPKFFILPIEYGLILVLAVFMRFSLDDRQKLGAFIHSVKSTLKDKGLDSLFTLKGLAVAAIAVAVIFAFGVPSASIMTPAAIIIAAGLVFLRKSRWVYGLSVLLVLVLFPLGFHWGQHQFTNIVHQDRNFFGVLRVVDTKQDERILMHGTTNHGAQALEEKYKLTPLSYYSPESPINHVFQYLNKQKRPQEVAILGLGIGVTACFAAPDRHFDFFEIDPDIADVAADTEYFTYLSDCGSPYDIILGDGRLTVQDKPDNHYDLIVLDAFSSDNIPVHLITLDAIQIYLSKLKDNGILIFNVSNNYIDLEPVLARSSDELDVFGLADLTNGGTIPDTELEYYPAHFFVMTKSEKVKNHLEGLGWSAGMYRDGVKAWTDQYSNIVSVLGNKIAIKRFKAKMKAEEEVQE